MKKQNGITLIALTITIIVICIFTGAMIELITGENGIIEKVAKAKIETKIAEVKESIQLAVIEAKVIGNNIITTDNLNEALKKRFNDDENAIEIQDGWHYKMYRILKDGTVERLILPYEYQQVEYLESTGKQFCLLNIKSTNTMGFDIDLYIERGTGANVFGGYTSGGNTFCYMGTRQGILSYFPNQSQINYTYIDYGKKHNYKLIKESENEKYQYYYDDEKKGESNLVNNPGCQIAVFSFIDSNGVIRTDPRETFIGRIYKFIIYDKTDIQCYLIPCYRKSDKSAGLYDLKEGVFYENRGEGEFLVGKDVL